MKETKVGDSRIKADEGDADGAMSKSSPFPDLGAWDCGDHQNVLWLQVTVHNAVAVKRLAALRQPTAKKITQQHDDGSSCKRF